LGFLPGHLLTSGAEWEGGEEACQGLALGPPDADDSRALASAD
jgi:hypothetical protein